MSSLKNANLDQVFLNQVTKDCQVIFRAGFRQAKFDKQKGKIS